MTAGETGYSVYGTPMNTNTADTVFLNSDDLSVPQSSSVNDPFFTNVPFSLAAGESSGAIDLFQFDVLLTAASGLFTGTYELLGGVGTANEFNFAPLGSQTFTVDVVSAPEPRESFAPMLCGALLVAAGRRRRNGVRRAGRIRRPKGAAIQSKCGRAGSRQQASERLLRRSRAPGIHRGPQDRQIVAACNGFKQTAL